MNMITFYFQFWFNSTSFPELLQMMLSLLKVIPENLWRGQIPFLSSNQQHRSTRWWLSIKSFLLQNEFLKFLNVRKEEHIMQLCTLMRLSTASLTAWTGRARSGIAFPSSASSWRMTSFDTWHSHKHLQYQTVIQWNTIKQFRIRRGIWLSPIYLFTFWVYFLCVFLCFLLAMAILFLLRLVYIRFCVYS